MDLLIFLYLIWITYCEVTWLPSVTGYNEFDFEDGYSGIIGRSIVGIKIEGGVTYRIHYVGKQNWEAETSGMAGDLKTQIDGIAIKGKTYRVYAKGVWLPPATDYNIKDDDNGYAGILNYPISGLMIYKCTYAVAISDEIITHKQVLVDYETGIKEISYRFDFFHPPIMEEGSDFMACCVIGGLANNAQIISAYSWAIKLGYINEMGSIIGIDEIELSKKISEFFGTEFHSGWALQSSNCNHYWVINEKGKEVFNSEGLHNKGNGCN